MDIKPFTEPRRAYEEGIPLHVIKQRYKMTDGEIRDIAPEEFADDYDHPEGVGGY